MKTKVFKNSIGTSADIIRRGGLVSVPTETVYGLAANGLDAFAVEKIYEVKGRPAVKPLSMMVRGKQDMERYCLDVPPQAYALADSFWPGPLTVVLKSKDTVPDIVRAGGSTVGLRCPDSLLTLELLNEAELPLAAPSANPSGGLSPKCADDVFDYFDGMIDAIIDGGECTLGIESTLIDMTSRPYRILRNGALSRDAVAMALVKAMNVVGITGPSGCGKSTASRILTDSGAGNGYIFIDCDKIYHRLLETSDELNEELKEEFGECYKEGALDRKALGKAVFTDSGKLLTLNRITHKHISREVAELLKEHAMLGGKGAIIDASELIGSPVEKYCSCIVSVLAPKDERIKRVMQRDGISRETAENRINAQHCDDYYKANSSVTVYNGSDMKLFEESILNIFKEVNENG